MDGVAMHAGLHNIALRFYSLIFCFIDCNETLD